MPWQEDPALKVDGRPAEAFPPYDVPIPSPLTDREKSQVRSFLLFREQVHDSPFYTETRSWNKTTLTSGSTTPRAYGQEQINQRYGIKNKATIDPFTAVEMPSSRLRRPERALPDFSERPFSSLACFFLFLLVLHVGFGASNLTQQSTSSHPNSTPHLTTKTAVAGRN